jgi:MFS family permease
MKNLVSKIGNILNAVLGRCPKCMRLSFISMLGACGLVLLAAMVTQSPALLIATRLIAAGAAALWLSHLMAYAKRNALRANGDVQPRRQFIAAFARSFIFVMAATAFPVGTVFAQSCDCASNMKCCWNYAGDVSVCAPLDANCCAHASSPWSCPQGHDCYGDAGGCT